MTTYRCAACSALLEVEKLPMGNTIEVEPCEACMEAAEEAALDGADAREFEVDPESVKSFLTESGKEKKT